MEILPETMRYFTVARVGRRGTVSWKGISAQSDEIWFIVSFSGGIEGRTLLGQPLAE